MKEIIVGVILAIAFLVVWLVGKNILVSIITTIACGIILFLTIKSLKKEKKVKVVINREEKYDKEFEIIKEHYFKIYAYMDIFKNLDTKKEVLDEFKIVCENIKSILDAVEKDRDLIVKLNDFYSYYLPGLLNIINTYDNLESSSNKTEEAEVFENNFILFLRQMGEAFSKKYYNLFSDEVLDSKLEMETMMRILKTDGLLEDFEGGIKHWKK